PPIATDFAGDGRGETYASPNDDEAASVSRSGLASNADGAVSVAFGGGGLAVRGATEGEDLGQRRDLAERGGEATLGLDGLGHQGVELLDAADELAERAGLDREHARAAGAVDRDHERRGAADLGLRGD